jgi:hypothetical protein
MVGCPIPIKFSVGGILCVVLVFLWRELSVTAMMDANRRHRVQCQVAFEQKHRSFGCGSVYVDIFRIFDLFPLRFGEREGENGFNLLRF